MRAGRIAAAVALLAVVCTLYVPALDASYQFDDYRVIVRDARVQSLVAWGASMPGMRPVLKLSYALGHELGSGVRGFRALNIAIHALNAVLVLLLLERLSRRHGLDARPAIGVAFASALVFALHPVQTEAVTYITGRSSSLMALACLASMLAWLRATGESMAGRDGRSRATASCGARWWAALLAALALATKESALVLPLALALWAATEPAGNMTGSAASVRSSWMRVSWPLLTVFAVTGLLLLSLAPYRELVADSLAHRSLRDNVLVQSQAIPYLVGQMVHIGRMNADPDLAIPQALSPESGLRLVLLAGVIVGGFAMHRRHPALAFGVLWFFVWLLPTHSLLPREDPVNDRQLYLALVGPAWLVMFTAWQGLRRLRLPAHLSTAAATVALAVVAMTLAMATLGRNRVYATEISYWEDAALRSPRKARVLNNLGYAYALSCRDAEAIGMFARAAELDPADFRSRVNLRLLQDGALFGEDERHCR